MKTSIEIKNLFNQLSADSQSRLLDDLLQEHELKGTILTAAQEEVVAKRQKKPCPYCKSESVYRRGKQNGVQMYRCNACEKWYSETTGTRCMI